VFEKQKPAANAMENRNSGDAGITKNEEWEKTGNGPRPALTGDSC
jgi:hypothetical protein